MHSIKQQKRKGGPSFSALRQFAVEVKLTSKCSVHLLLFLGYSSEPKAIQNRFRSSLGKPLTRDSVSNLIFSICLRFYMHHYPPPAGPICLPTRFSLRLPFQGVRKLTTKTPSGIPTGLAACRYPSASAQRESCALPLFRLLP